VDSDVTTGCFGSYSTTYTHDSRRLLTAEVRAGTNSYNKGYTYDGMYCRTQKTVGGTATNYTYNDLGRITAATGGTAFTCVYDDNGNLTAKTTGLIVESFAFDWKNNLVRYQNSDTAEDMYYGYDIGNTRIIKARPEEGGGTYDVCADISGWKHFFHKTHGDRWLYAESETDGVNWWWTTQYTLDNYTGIGFIENVQTARTGFPVDIYSGTVDIWGNNRVMYDSSETCVLNAEYDIFFSESYVSGGWDLFGGARGERNAEAAYLSICSGALPSIASEHLHIRTTATSWPNSHDASICHVPGFSDWPITATTCGGSCGDSSGASSGSSSAGSSSSIYNPMNWGQDCRGDAQRDLQNPRSQTGKRINCYIFITATFSDYVMAWDRNGHYVGGVGHSYCGGWVTEFNSPSDNQSFWELRRLQPDLANITSTKGLIEFWVFDQRISAKGAGYPAEIKVKQYSSVANTFTVSLYGIKSKGGSTEIQRVSLPSYLASKNEALAQRANPAPYALVPRNDVVEDNCTTSSIRVFNAGAHDRICHEWRAPRDLDRDIRERAGVEWLNGMRPIP